MIKPEEMPEVQAYENARSMYESFKTVHLPVIEKLREFLEHMNQTREAAEKAIRAARVSYGDFDLYQQVEKVNGDDVLNAVGRERFLAIGGTIKEKKEAKIGGKQLKVALARGEVTQDLYNAVVKIEDRYHVPKAGTLP